MTPPNRFNRDRYDSDVKLIVDTDMTETTWPKLTLISLGQDVSIISAPTVDRASHSHWSRWDRFVAIILDTLLYGFTFLSFPSFKIIFLLFPFWIHIITNSNNHFFFELFNVLFSEFNEIKALTIIYSLWILAWVQSFLANFSILDKIQAISFDFCDTMSCCQYPFWSNHHCATNMTQIITFIGFFLIPTWLAVQF